LTYIQFVITNFRWLLAGLLLAFFSSFGQTFFIALSTGPIRKAFDLTSGEYGSLYMIATLASALVLSYIGRAVDHYSVRKVAVVTTLMLALACLLLAISTSIFLLTFAIFGLRLFGQGMLTHISLTAMAKWFVAGRGKAVSIAQLGFNFGQAVLPIIFVAVIALVGWQQSWIIAAMVLLIVALPTIIYAAAHERNPQTLEPESLEISASLRQWTRNEMLRDPVFWLVSTGVLAPPFIGTAIFFHQDFILTERGWSYEIFALGFVVLTVVSVISGLISGVFIDRKSAVIFLPTTLLPMALGCFVLAFGDTDTAMLIYMALLGISSGVASAVLGSVWPEVYGTRHLGAIRSVIMALTVLLSALGPGVMGWMIDFDVGLNVQFLGFGIYCTIASVAMAIAARKFLLRQQPSQF